MTRVIDDERINVLADVDSHDGGYVLYWMQAAQRAEHNHALEFAVQRANAHGVPLVVAAVVVPDYPQASLRSFAFMLHGLGVALRAVERRGGRTCLRVGDPVEVIGELAGDACEVVVDRGYLRHQRRWYRRLCAATDRRITQIETEVVVPVGVVSAQRETAARTIRPKVNEHRDRFLVDLDTTPIDADATVEREMSDIDLDDLGDVASTTRVLRELGIELDEEPGVVEWLTPGTPGARRRLDAFFDHLDEHDRDGGFDASRNRYTDSLGVSAMSAYLHFGQISPIAVGLRAVERMSDPEPFLEELIVRRELAVNFVTYESDYDAWTGLPDWARTSLDEHRDDARDAVYTHAELEAGETDDEVWNAIMNRIRVDGWLHNQLRMYWGKQIVRWTNTPEHAFHTLLRLNNRWFLDGRDPNSYANVGWCFGLHDQGFKERTVSGKLRPFTTAALERKDDLRAWLDEAS